MGSVLLAKWTLKYVKHFFYKQIFVIQIFSEFSAGGMKMFLFVITQQIFQKYGRILAEILRSAPLTMKIIFFRHMLPCSLIDFCSL